MIKLLFTSITSRNSNKNEDDNKDITHNNNNSDNLVTKYLSM